MVWIHGGAYEHGFSGSPGYDARHLARDGDVVFVSLNYRLGESAGAGSIAALMVMPSAAGLFRRAVWQSLPGTYFSDALARDVAAAIAAEAGLRPTAADLSGVDPRELPAIVPAAPWQALAAGTSAEELYELVQTDWLFRMPTLRLAEAQAAGAAGPTCTSRPGSPRATAGSCAPATAWTARCCSAPTTPTWARRPSAPSTPSRRAS
ncbi:carboxylesterase family protein [Nonomuraea angiospora]|nr:carboxylesterase family protein [Nonomuraea angiospora]